MYISLKGGWLPLSDLCDKYEKDKGNMNRILNKMADTDKEKIGNVWLVRESKFVENIKTETPTQTNELTQIEEMIDLFTSELSKNLTPDTVRSKFAINGYAEGDYALKTILDWCIKTKVTFPNIIYDYLEEEPLYTKSLLVINLWNKTLKQKK